MTMDTEKLLDFGELKIYEDDYLATYQDANLNLTAIEFNILKLLAKNKNKTLDRNRIYKQVWGTYTYDNNRTVDVHVCHLRKKLKGKFIKTMKPIGYKFEF